MFKEIFSKMMKEEWRIHTTSFNNKMFAFFPLIIFVLSFVGCLFIPFLKSIITIDQIFKYAHYVFIFFGLSVGAFGLFGKEIMNRRFGQASLIAYSSRSLPVSERSIFFAFFAKDIVYYLHLWIIPIFAGFLVTSQFIGINFISALYACFTLVLSFLLGLSAVFLLSTIYAHSSKILIALILSIFGIYFSMSYFLSIQVNFLILPFLYYYNLSLRMLLEIILLILIPLIISIIFVKFEYPEKKKFQKNQLTILDKKVAFSKYSFYIAKDFLDLKRSEGGLGKIIFSFLLPIAFTYIFLSIFLELIPTVKTIMIFSIFLGIVSSSIYNMLTAFDTFNPYMFLPVRVSTVLKGKITTFMIINILSILILIIATITMNQILYFLPAFLMFMSIAIYSLAVTVYFTGLNPNILIYDSKIFVPYIASLGPILFTFTLVAIINPFYMVASPLLIPLAIFLLKKGYVKWDKWVPQNI